MHPSAALLALLTLLLHIATPAKASFSWKAGATSFSVYQSTIGNKQIEAAIKTCIEKDITGRTKSQGTLCVLDATTYLFGAVPAFFGPGFGIAAIYDLAPAQETKESGNPPKRDLTYDRNKFLEAFNKHLTDHLPNDFIRANAIVPSVLHPNDGLAFKMNMHSDNSTLHMHTNGTHMLATFHDDDGQDLERRRLLPTHGKSWQFTGISGIKVQWRNVNHDPNGIGDLRKILPNWINPVPIVKNPIVASSQWSFQGCNTAKSATFFYGQLNFKTEKPKLQYEAMSPPGC